MWELIITVGLQLLGTILGNNADNKKMMELFYKWVEKIQGMYLKSAHLSDDAKKRWKELMEKPFVESP